jgi:Cytochrome c554 and c-prime
MANLKNAGHLLRMAAVFAVGIVLFLVARSIFVPKSFGQYGHYRAAALAEIAAKPIMFAGHGACENCHTDVYEVKNKGVHTHVACESCHGPLAKHADDPTALTPPKIDVAALCVRCHEAGVAKPKNFPQVASAEHSGRVVCNTCHQPHSPRIASADTASTEKPSGDSK